MCINLLFVDLNLYYKDDFDLKCSKKVGFDEVFEFWGCGGVFGKI
jgi:hypothetical protein